MRYLITGGAGYIGSLLTEKLLHLGHFVRVLDNGQRNNCDSLLGFVGDNQFQFIRGNITESDTLRTAFNSIDNCIHLAAAVGMPITTQHSDYSELVNVYGTTQLLRAKPKKVKLFFASTGSVYGKIQGICNEDSPCNPLSHYGKHKLHAERLTLDKGNSFAYRFATAYGMSRNMRTDLLINDLVLQATKNKTITIFQGDFGRTFIHVQDFCDSIIWGFENFDKVNGQVFNVGDDNNNWTKRKLAIYLKQKTGCTVFYADEGYIDPDARDYAVSHKKINDVGWFCKVGMEEGIDEVIKGCSLLGIGNNRYQDKLL